MKSATFVSRMARLAFALPLVAVFSLSGRPAHASHYAVADVPRLITATEAEKLHKAGVNTTEELLAKAAKSKDRKALAKSSGLGTPVLLDLARRCDLLRIKGVGSEMVLLLEASGVKTTTELAKKDVAGLVTAVASANQAKKISEKPPTEPQLQYWIDEAKRLPPVIETK
jgi:predicted flap endonuclease-1-like 5' DNA nuclease